MKILLLNDCNMWEYKDPLAYLIECDKELTDDQLWEANRLQPGVSRSGTHISEMLQHIRKLYGVSCEIEKEGRKSDFEGQGYREYLTISGNY